jgi:hypothetical protein
MERACRTARDRCRSSRSRAARAGVGKTTVAVNLALALTAQGRRTGLIDADLYGPDVPRMMGLRRRAEDVERHAVRSPGRAGFPAAGRQPARGSARFGGVPARREPGPGRPGRPRAADGPPAAPRLGLARPGLPGDGSPAGHGRHPAVRLRPVRPPDVRARGRHPAGHRPSGCTQADRAPASARRPPGSGGHRRRRGGEHERAGVPELRSDHSAVSLRAAGGEHLGADPEASRRPVQSSGRAATRTKGGPSWSPAPSPSRSPPTSSSPSRSRQRLSSMPRAAPEAARSARHRSRNGCRGSASGEQNASTRSASRSSASRSRIGPNNSMVSVVGPGCWPAATSRRRTRR